MNILKNFPLTIGITELRNNISQILKTIKKQKKIGIILSKNKPQAVIIPYEIWENQMNNEQNNNIEKKGKKDLSKELPDIPVKSEKIIKADDLFNIPL
ncbi:hypothetical protein A2483_00865 [Candidatus Peregrinibacteria bacterium RIFOXYC2_FULL_33_13]|nr:MAG: hypothetical protein UR27_C0002G0082 [Candidatus Peregrinibacteria bacterium GW2011_GWA2_33_10]KKP41096.1 MAG: hypothetical protein UR30_C0002G0130 [Candidatus Peregrinibacteria bacterium GW2011_GWC2_33_13]OGJ49813.1 MAG: hypothetical protein A2229_00800 [Candidatus Peregrinibacteria bacterium RIFOXYA2_FULL_33_7]OGJ52107.1 MAG: hypothetical protein A2483_00865 [Candidatus Peregrinibacteria bacterium RIFOXYC2_FULL_33_13]